MAASPTKIPVAIARILCATDFSPSADHALSCALALARQCRAKVFLLHVLEAAPSAASTEFSPDATEPDRQQADKHFRALENSGALKSVDHSILIRRGALCHVVEDIVSAHEIDLVVIGTRGHTGFKKVLLGSAAERVCRRAPCPVMTIGPHVTVPSSVLRFTRILYATDFLTGSLKIAPLALSLADQAHGTVTLLHVIEEGGRVTTADPRSAPEGVSRKLTDLLPAGSGLHITPHVLAPFGPPAETILKVADGEQSDLIVMGMRAAPGGALTTHMPKTVAPYVISHARCPVLTVHG
jgi:nucleotide-binding universal stress UspA family protein